ncbi:MAG: hypothetical protein FGM37_09520 [Phycisphaerales bacterium]|nr:hypothetical protein [Phycisphaerales bacterium]
MLLYAGFDEAGYGPLLGPLCVASTAFLVPDGDPHAPPDLWKSLSQGVCSSRRDRRGRVAICDSKALKGVKDARAHPLHAIERGVLAAASTLHGAALHDERSLDDALAPADTPRGSHGATAACEADGAPLPCACSSDEVSVATAMLRRACDSKGVRLVHMRCDPISPTEINAESRRGLTKPSIPFARAARMAVTLLDAHPSVPVRLAFDRQGGRMRYSDDLQHSFECTSLAILHEDEERSCYRFVHSGRTVVASFETSGESVHLPVALASMVAKYVRELRMARLNRYFAAAVPGVAPTAGYVTDGRRFLAQVEPHLQALGIERSCLVRSI